jgi:Mg-chelatase subunit ChlD
MAKRRRGRGLPWLILVVLIAGWLHNRRSSRRPDAAPPGPEAGASRVNPLDAELAAAPAVPSQEGIGAAILLDASGSMADEVPDATGKRRPKIAIARRSVTDVVRRFQAFAAEHPDRTVRVALLEFSHRDRQPAARVVLPAGPPDAASAATALAGIAPKAATPIGDAMLEAKRVLDRTGLSHRHIVVVTDGESNRGYHPADVAAALARQSGEARAGVYFVAFDVAAERFNAVRDTGALVLGASSEADLNQALDYLLTGKILVEQPAAPTR